MMNETPTDLKQKRRDLFSELAEGFKALELARKGAVSLKMTEVQSLPDADPLPGPTRRRPSVPGNLISMGRGRS